MTEDFQIRVKLDGSGKATSTETGVAGSGSQAQAEGAFKSVLDGMGLGAGIALLSGLVDGFKPLLSMVAALTKVVMLTLMPISQVIMGLLYPVLLIMKPIVLAVNQIMMPFLTQAMEFMREGTETGNAGMVAAGMTTLMAGLNAVILYMSSSLMTFVTTAFLTVVAEIVGLISDDGKSFITDQIIPNIQGIMETATASGIGAIAMQITNMGALLGADMSSFNANVVSMIDGVFPNLSDEFITGLEEALALTETDGIKAGYTALLATTADEWSKYSVAASQSIYDAFFDMITAVGSGEISLEFLGIEEESFFGKLFDTVRENWDLIGSVVAPRATATYRLLTRS
jgi:hypothetical protein